MPSASWPPRPTPSASSTPFIATIRQQSASTTAPGCSNGRKRALLRRQPSRCAQVRGLPKFAVITHQAAPLRGAEAGAPRAGLWPWRGPARRARAAPATAGRCPDMAMGRLGVTAAIRPPGVRLSCSRPPRPGRSLRSRRMRSACADPGPSTRSRGDGACQEGGGRAGSLIPEGKPPTRNCLGERIAMPQNPLYQRAGARQTLLVVWLTGCRFRRGLAFGVDAVPGGHLHRPLAGRAAEDHLAQ
jgi:hypothetical protein